MTATGSLSTRSSLLRRLKNPDDSESWNRFVQTYRSLIEGLSLKAGLTETEAKDVLQEVLISVARNIGRFEYNRKISSFKRWLTILTRWRIRDVRQRRLAGLSGPHASSGSRGGESDPLDKLAAAEPAGHEAQWSAEWSQALLEAGLQRLRKRVSAKHFQIYYLHVIKSQSVPEVMRHLAVSRASIQIVKWRVGRLLRRELDTLRKQMGE